jgi:16S rRNA (adenine1518-N6/adenine1519-N6)-dimethyltransferase
MVKAKKSFSQNFLVDASIPAAIAAALPLMPGVTNHVLEVGAGLGALTLPLLQHLSPADRLTAVEVDPACLKRLQPQIDAYAYARLLGQNVLGVWPEDVTPDLALIHVVGNLPYHMTGQILFHFCGEMIDLSPRWRPRVGSFTLMVQQEVADRLMALPGNADINPMTWAIQTWFEIKPILAVPPSAFRPRPRVNSAVIQLVPRPQPLFDPMLVPAAARLIKASFSQPRKTLRNNWQATFADDTHPIWQAATAEEQQARAHTITLPQWQHWSTAIHQANQ